MLRWKCNKCNLTWIYPVGKCAHCKGKIVKDKTTKAKVIGITKVTIPSTMHPIVPYNVILLEDEHGNRMPRKTMKEYSIGDEFVEEKAKTESAVSIVKVKYDVYDAVEHAIELINFDISGDSKVLIKPSIIFPAYPYQAINTNPKTVDAIIKILLKKGIGPDNIIVGEQAPFGIDTGAAVAKSGILKVCRENKVNVLDLSKTKFVEKIIDDYKFKISREILNKDLVINIPVLKTHSQWNIAGALENMTRIVDVDTQEKMCRSNVDENIAHLNKALKYITIGDATTALQGQGPFASGEPAFLNLILASRDPVALDRIFCEIGFFDVPNYIKIADDIELGKSDLNQIEIVGYDVESVKTPLIAAKKNPSPHSKIKVIDGRAWPGDYVVIYNILSRIIGLGGKKFSIVVGRIFGKDDLKDTGKIMAFGDNAIERLQELGVEPSAKIPGNPPDNLSAMVLIKKMLKKQSINVIDKLQSKMTSSVSLLRR